MAQTDGVWHQVGPGALDHTITEAGCSAPHTKELPFFRIPVIA